LTNLGVLIQAAWGLDRSWWEGAACRRYAKASSLIPSPWQFDRVQRVRHGDVVYRGEEMIKVALTFCQACPSQYACARFAVEAKMKAGTWAMDAKDLAWLASIADPMAAIDWAEDSGEPIQRVVVRMRQDVRGMA